MAKAQDIAKYLLTLAQPDEGDLISNLKLQKLAYFAQGFGLVLNGAPLFPERIEAWEHGPVVPELYHSYKECGGGALPIPEGFDADAHLTKEEQSVLDEVWNVYGQFSAWKLRNMTHEEGPWVNTAKGAVISHEAMRAYFQTLIH
jgi:uncharacterized phage-associated protein